ncbi:MAG: hypothetical protein RL693_1439 [Verrucomicrobiota bacterium]|jgi:hypothetical protein
MRMVRGAGFEPDVVPCKIKPPSVGVSQILSQVASSEPSKEALEICEVLAAWEELPRSLKAAVLAIIRTHTQDLITNRGREHSDRSEGRGSPRREATISGAGASELANGSQSYRFREQVGPNP